MIVTRLMGGLGNQMFQWAAARALALRHGVEAKVDLSYLEHLHPTTTPRPYELTCFAVEPPIATPDDLRWARSGEPHGLPARARDAVKTLLRPQRLRLLQQEGLGFDDRVLHAGPNVLLVGYWPSERYFGDAEGTIRADFRFTRPLVGADAEFAAEIAACDAVSVHVRRGDYVADARTNAFHGSLEPEWYVKAVDEIKRRVPGAVAFVFSDEPDWCRDHMRLPVPTRVVDHDSPRRAADDLRLMTLCRHHVVANSSFSWWGAWLAGSGEGMVVAPRRWFQDPAIDTAPITPSSWLRL